MPTVTCIQTIAEAKSVSDTPVVIADEQGFILYVNQTFQSVFGWLPAEILGRSLTTIIPKALHDAHHLGFSRFLRTGTPTLLGRSITLKAINKDGHEFACRHFIIAEQRDGAWNFAATITPTTTTQTTPQTEASQTNEV